MAKGKGEQNKLPTDIPDDLDRVNASVLTKLEMLCQMTKNEFGRDPRIEQVLRDQPGIFRIDLLRGIRDGRRLRTNEMRRRATPETAEQTADASRA